MIIVALGWQLRSVHSTIETQRETIADLRADLRTAESANDATVEALDECTRVNEEVIAKIQADLDRAEAEASAAAEVADQLRGELDTERRRRRDIYATDPDAATWAATRVPGAIADRLRRRAGTEDSNPG